MSRSDHPAGATDPLARLDAQSIETAFADRERKQAFVTPMFDVIAPRYDQFTRLFSFGMDRAWKAQLINRVRQHVPERATLVDVACGTGDLVADFTDDPRVSQRVGVDASVAMIAAARARHHAGTAHFIAGDIMALPLPDASVELLTAGYALRNTPDLDDALGEIARVVTTGGVVAVLDFYRPERLWWRVLFLGYLRVAGDLVGWWWHRRPVVYGYIARSVDAFVSATDFSAALDRAGFDLIDSRRYLLGGIGLHLARRRTDRRRATDLVLTDAGS
jgi:demethylmenaquinone methyltransferase / 2-methoxy-6-polyprenyl-1,4-benzoquinol methylase